jgi:cbb3-type cytochrome oxidase subunit 3
MRPTDIVSSLGLTFFPILGMALFLAVFIGVVLQVTGRTRRTELDRAGALPLEDEALPTAAHPAPRATEANP